MLLRVLSASLEVVVSKYGIQFTNNVADVRCTYWYTHWNGVSYFSGFAHPEYVVLKEQRAAWADMSLVIPNVPTVLLFAGVIARNRSHHSQYAFSQNCPLRPEAAGLNIFTRLKETRGVWETRAGERNIK